MIIHQANETQVRMSMLQPYSVLLFDIEGTTSAISFVTETLFPFAATHLADFLEKNIDQLDDVVHAFREQALHDLEMGRNDVVPIPLEDRSAILESIVYNALAQITADRKVTPLKFIQGQIWAEGYQTGTLKGHVFDDVLSTFQNLVAQQKRIYIYSSGSVQAQKLLFGHSIAGDLRSYISGYFDTNIGHKIHEKSYRDIANEIGVPCYEVLFLTDKFSEADAASKAGCQVVILNRPGNLKQPPNRFITWTNFKMLCTR